jgi:glycosyltransferase involved in cell wall biosynthesis
VNDLATIAIPTFNRADLLAKAVDAACGQDYPAVEILIVDNASTDGTEQLCRALVEADDRVRYLRQRVNVGPVGNFATALDEARGSYFMWLADDDWISANYLSACIHELEQGHVLVVGADHWDSVRTSLPADPVRALEPDPQARILGYLRRIGNNAAAYGIARTADCRRVLPLPTYLGGDWVWVLRLLRMGTLQVADSAQLHRGADGGSGDLGQLARVFDQPSWVARLPRTSVALRMLREAARDPLLRAPGGPWQRWAFAVRVGTRALVAAQVGKELRLAVKRVTPGPVQRVRTALLRVTRSRSQP